MAMRYSNIKNKQVFGKEIDVSALENNTATTTATTTIPQLFESLSISNIQYDENHKPTMIVYSSGNKQVINYNSNSRVNSVDYFDTNGVSKLATQSFNYEANGSLINTNWQLF